MGKYIYGIDLGGTTVKMGLFDGEGNIIDKWEIVTRKEDNGSNILPDIAASIKEKNNERNISAEDITGIGIGVPGPVTEDGRVLKCANLGWGIFSVADELSRLTGVANVKAGNDANVAALGEQWRGGGKGFKSIVMVTLGTGVGGGVIYNGKIVTGCNGAAGEIGFLQQLGEGSFLIRFAGSIHAEACAFHLHRAKHHLWMLHKVAVHCDAVFIGIKVNPVWLGVDDAVTLL